MVPHSSESAACYAMSLPLVGTITTCGDELAAAFSDTSLYGSVVVDAQPDQLSVTGDISYGSLLASGFEVSLTTAAGPATTVSSSSFTNVGDLGTITTTDGTQHQRYESSSHASSKGGMSPTTVWGSVEAGASVSLMRNYSFHVTSSK